MNPLLAEPAAILQSINLKFYSLFHPIQPKAKNFITCTRSMSVWVYARLSSCKVTPGASMRLIKHVPASLFIKYQNFPTFYKHVIPAIKLIETF